MATRKIFVAFFDARILPLAKRARVTPTTVSVARTAWTTMPGSICSKMYEIPPTKTPCAAA